MPYAEKWGKLTIRKLGKYFLFNCDSNLCAKEEFMSEAHAIINDQLQLIQILPRLIFLANNLGKTKFNWSQPKTILFVFYFALLYAYFIAYAYTYILTVSIVYSELFIQLKELIPKIIIMLCLVHSENEHLDGYSFTGIWGPDQSPAYQRHNRYLLGDRPI